MCPHFFDSHASFTKYLRREKSMHMMEHYVGGYMDDTMLTSRVEAYQGGNGGVHMDLDHEGMKRILIRVTKIDKAQCNNKQHM
jgi:hypothetical protein